MKRLALLAMLVVIGFSFSAPSAEAKRLGGGGSFGKQRDASPQQMQKAPAATPAASPAAAQPAAGNKWLGPLAGLALGAGLFALLSSAGLDGALGGILMALLAVGAVMFLLSRFRKSPPAMQYAGNAAAHGGTTGNRFEHHPVAGGGQTAAVVSDIDADIPADFPAEAFLRSAKTSFIRLQAANDRKDIDDVREYTTPEMFAEIAMQIKERDNTPQSTNVLTISTTLLSVQNEGDYAIASVRMRGELSENKGAAEAFDEVWHVQKNLHEKDAVWLLAGIQQVA